MTIVEFFDKNALDNIVSSLVCECDKVIFVGDNSKQIYKALDDYKEVLARHGAFPELDYMTANKNQLTHILSVLERIVLENDDIVFDLTGGDELFLVGAGIIMGKFPDTVSCHRYNVRTDVLADCDLDGKICSSRHIKLSCNDCVTLYGGKNMSVNDWSFDSNFVKDIYSLWEITKKYGRLWNVHATCLGTICVNFPSSSPLILSFDRLEAKEVLERLGYEIAIDDRILRELEKYGLIKSLRLTELDVSFEFKNEQIKKCLITAGQVLELFVASRLVACSDEDNEPIYNDVKVGMVLDWEADDEDTVIRTTNEIDVLAMRGFVPVFISCKNGAFDVNELYKLSSVAAKFGFDYAKKVIVTTELDSLGVRGEYLKERAKDMGIRIINNIDTMSLNEIKRVFKSLWTN